MGLGCNSRMDGSSGISHHVLDGCGADTESEVRMKIEMTGIEDRQGPWKLAVCGYAGVGKTMLGSTARNPLFVFFGETPRLKSIALRGIPHVKLSNELGLDGSLQASVQDQLQALVMYLQLEANDYDTLVVDTGDELFQQMKRARTIKNGGEFKVGDWGWIGDTYREVIMGLIDLPMNIIVNYHIKTSSDDEGSFKELSLQGAAKDDAPTWFDIVGVIDTYMVTNEDGDDVMKRALMLQSSSYPWVKDHSGVLGNRFEISDDFIGDIPRLLELVNAEEDAPIAHEVLDEIVKKETPVPEIRQGIPTPDDLHAKKEEKQPDETAVPVEAMAQEEVPIPPQEDESVGSPSDSDVVQEEATDSSPDAPESGSVPEAQDVPAEQGDQALQERELRPADAAPLNVEEAIENVKEVFPEAEEVNVFKCDVCDEVVDDADLRDLSQIRFRKYLCRPHFREALAKKKG